MGVTVTLQWIGWELRVQIEKTVQSSAPCMSHITEFWGVPSTWQKIVLAELCFLWGTNWILIHNLDERQENVSFAGLLARTQFAPGRSYDRPSWHRLQLKAVTVLNIPSCNCLLLMQSSRLKYTEIYPPALSVKIIKLNFQIMPFSISEISEIRRP